MPQSEPQGPAPETGNPETGNPETGNPATGNPEVDAALARLSDLDAASLDDHHERLAAVHETLHGLLDGSTRHE